ncbi:MAG: hypothetical protein KHZ58_14335 [Hungatella hathewayi]|nr:hypothetical protein [Hungatella hathewayi]
MYMRNDDELIGMEDVQAFELELLRRRRRMFHSQSDWKSESGILSEPMLKSRSGIRMKAEPDAAGAALETAAVSEIVEEPSSRQTPEPVLDIQPDSDATQPALDATQLAPDAEPPICPSSRYSILSERLMDERRYADLVKSVNDLQFREQLYEEYGIVPQDTTE